MNILAILKAVLSIADWLSKIAHDKQLLSAGAYQAIAVSNGAALEKIRIAMDARRNLPDSMSDPNNRDND